MTRKEDGANVIDIPLIRYLLLLKSDLYAQMPSQEFLDRESEWSFDIFPRQERRMDQNLYQN